MPVAILEKTESRRGTRDGSSDFTEVVYTITGTDDDVAVYAAVRDEAEDNHDGMPRGAISIEPIIVIEGEGDKCRWEGTVTYRPLSGQPAPPPATGESEFEFDTTGGTQHITQSLATISKHSPSGTPPDFKGAIGVTDDDVLGVDVVIPVYQFAETHYIPDGDVDDAYKAALYAATGKVNNATFRGFAAGEVLFMGARGRRRSDQDWEITFRFAASPNATGLAIGDISGIDKKGWEYLWVRYADVEDSAAKMIVKRPIAAVVEKVYNTADFGTLAIS